MKNFFKKNWKRLLIATLAITAAVAVPMVAFAAVGDITIPVASTEISGMVEGILQIQKFLNYLIWPVLMLIGALLENDIFFGGGMGARLQEIWIIIRNVVNIFFVVVLVGVAIYNVLGIGEDSGSYAIKSILPKLIVGIIVINFSFLGAKVFLDGVNVLTSAIFAIPSQIAQGLGDGVTENDADFEVTKEKLCSEDTPLFGYNPDAPAETNIYCNASGITPAGLLFLDKYGKHNAALLLAIKGGKILYYSDVPVTNTSVDKLTITAFFSLVLYLVYSIAFIALLVVLFARVVVLWLGIALSPILILAMVPDIKSKLGKVGELADQFVKHAVAPLIIALALTVGWIMLSGIQGAAIPNGDQEIVPVAGLSNFQDLIAAIAVVIVVWIGAFEAAKGTYAGAVTDKIRAFATTVGSWLITAPIRYWPILPGKLGGEGHSGPVTFQDILGKGKEVYSNMERATKGYSGGGSKARSLSKPVGSLATTDFTVDTLKAEGIPAVERYQSEMKNEGSEFTKALKRDGNLGRFEADLNTLKSIPRDKWESDANAKRLLDNLGQMAEKAKQTGPAKPEAAQTVPEQKAASSVPEAKTTPKSDLKDGVRDILKNPELKKQLKEITGDKATTTELKKINATLKESLKGTKGIEPLAEGGLNLEQSEIKEALGDKYDETAKGLKDEMMKTNPMTTDSDVEKRIASLINTGDEPVAPAPVEEKPKDATPAP